MCIMLLSMKMKCERTYLRYNRIAAQKSLCPLVFSKEGVGFLSYAARNISVLFLCFGIANRFPGVL